MLKCLPPDLHGLCVPTHVEAILAECSHPVAGLNLFHEAYIVGAPCEWLAWKHRGIWVPTRSRGELLRCGLGLVDFLCVVELLGLDLDRVRGGASDLALHDSVLPLLEPRLAGRVETVEAEQGCNEGVLETGVPLWRDLPVQPDEQLFDVRT